MDDHRRGVCRKMRLVSICIHHWDAERAGTMIVEERCDRIVEFVEKHQYASITQLMDLVHASKSTVRRDILRLEREGRINSVRGGVASVKETSAPEMLYLEKAAEQIGEKQRIGRAAATLLKNRDTVYIAPGTTTRCIIPYIDPDIELNVLTNDIAIAMDLSDRDRINVNVSGGQLRHHYYTLRGYAAEESVRNYRISMAFLGCDAIDLKAGCYIANADEVGFLRQIVEGADQVAVLADSSKFDRAGFISFCDMTKVDYLVTDKELTRDQMEECATLGTLVVKG